MYDGFVYTCKDIIRRGSKNTTKNITRDCAWCEFRDICMAEMSGGDRDYVIKERFKTKE